MARSKFIGVYSTVTRPNAGASQVSFKGEKPRKRLWFIWEGRNKFRYGKREINSIFQAIGDFEDLTPTEFESIYKHEPDILAFPSEDYTEPEPTAEEQKILDEKAAHKRAIHARVLEIKLRERFSLEIAKMRRGNITDSAPAIRNLLSTEEGITEDHIYMFTDFGIDLRKVKFYDLARLSFERAKELCEDDPNIWFNLARINFESREYESALKCVKMTLHYENDHEYGLKLLKAIMKAKDENAW